MSTANLMRVRIIKLFLVLASVGGLIAIAASLMIPSMDRRALLLGYSGRRVLVSIIFAGLAIALSVAAVKALLDPSWVSRIIDRLDEGFFKAEDRLLGSLVALLFLAITTAYLLFLFEGYGVRHAPYALQIAFKRFAFPIAWLVFLYAGLSVVLVLLYGQGIRNAVLDPVNPSYALLLIVLVGTSIHWITLLLRSDFWIRIPLWFWPVRPPVRLGPASIFILLACLIGFFVVRTVLREPGRKLRNMILLIGLAYTLQIGFGFARGHGYESIRSKYANQELSDETRQGCASQTSITESIRHYEDLYADTSWLGTKPPGLIIFYQTTRDLLRIVDPGAMEGVDSCFRNVTMMSAIALPLLASLVILPLYGTERLLRPGQDRYASSLLYMSAPSFLLMPLVPDQFLFPLLFMIAVFSVAATLARRSFVLGFVSGGVIFLSIFVSFSLLPLIGLVMIWLPLEGLLKERHITISRSLYLLSAVVLGIGTLWLAALLFVDYDPINRYANAFALHRKIKEFDGAVASILQNVHLNNVDFALWTGWPLFMLMIWGMVASVIMAFRRKADRKAIFAVSLLATYILLNLLGQTRGEVGRLWMYLLPAAAIVASDRAAKLFRDPVRSVQLVFMLQLGTAFLAFIYLDFR